jgi:hypothetical protein
MSRVDSADLFELCLGRARGWGGEEGGERAGGEREKRGSEEEGDSGRKGERDGE